MTKLFPPLLVAPDTSDTEVVEKQFEMVTESDLEFLESDDEYDSDEESYTDDEEYSSED